MNKKYYIASFITMLFATLGVAQSMQVYSKFENGALRLRWKPATAQSWLLNSSAGYQIQKYQGNVLADQVLVQPMATADLLQQDDTTDNPFYSVAAILYMDQLDQEIIDETFLPGEYTEAEKTEARFEVLNYLLHFDFDLTLFAGLGYRDTNLLPVIDYRYVITPLLNPAQSATFSFNASTVEDVKPPALEASWSDRRVRLKWNSRVGKDHFFGYGIQVAINENPFDWVDTVPIINLYDTSSLEIFHFIEKEYFLENNQHTYTYRLVGRDYFGGISTLYSEVKGKGRMEIGMSPVITATDQLPTNEVKLEWELLDQFKDLVTGFNIYVAENWEGPYFPDTMDVDPAIRMLTRTIPFGGTYFRVAAVDQDNREHSSFPQLVMAYDTTAPATPVDLSYAIDTNGILNIQWSPNMEEDFIGYKVFFGNDSTDQFGLAHYGYLEHPSFVDTIFLISTNENIYYKIIAVDTRNNRSPFSNILTVEKPDVLPPVEPHFQESVPGPGTVLLRWYPSISEDVVTQTLYRRILDVETDWGLVQEWQGDSLPVEYLDRNLSAEFDYAYLLTVTDDAGLVSSPSEPIAITVFPDHNDLDVNNFSVKHDAEATSNTISWAFDLNEVYQVWLYRQVNDEAPRLLQKIEPPRSTYEDVNLNLEQQVEYFLQVIFKDGVKSVYSAQKSID